MSNERSPYDPLLRDAMEPSTAATMTLSNRRTRVRIERHGEHHMGAEHMRIAIEPPLAGCHQLQGTNLSAAFSVDGRFLIINDACVVLVLDTESDDVGHMLPPRGWYFADVQLVDGRATVRLFGGSVRKPPEYGPFELDRIVNEGVGFGPVRGGRMPSLFEPWWIESVEGDSDG